MRMTAPQHHFTHNPRTIPTSTNMPRPFSVSGARLTVFLPPSFPPSYPLLPTSDVDSPETKAATASALTLSPLSLNARKMARLAAAVVEDDMRALHVCDCVYGCPNSFIACPFCGDFFFLWRKACVRASFSFIRAFGADLPIPANILNLAAFLRQNLQLALAHFAML